MAKVGYIFKAEADESYQASIKWMQEYSCDKIFVEDADTEQTREKWMQLLSILQRGDELVLAKMSNALRKTHELSALIELCHTKQTRLISIGDRIDSAEKLFPETTVSDVLRMIGALPLEATAIRKKVERIGMLKNTVPKKKPNVLSKGERERMVVNMYNGGHCIDEIWAASGYKARCSVFRTLNRFGVKLNRGRFSGPLGPRKKKDDTEQGNCKE